MYNCNEINVIRQGVFNPLVIIKNRLLIKLYFIMYKFFASLLKKIIVKGITKNKLGGIIRIKY